MAKKQQMAKASRTKRTHKFQLNINKGDELWLHEWIPKLTKQRKFSQFVRDGLGLMISFAEWGITAQAIYDMVDGLRQGSLAKVFELFPHIRAQFEAGQGTPQETPAPQPQPVQVPVDQSKELDELRESNKQLREMVENLTELVLSIKTNGGYVMQSTQPSPVQPTGKMLTDKQFALPVFDDEDEDETVPSLDIKGNQSSAANLMRMFSSLANDTDEAYKRFKARGGDASHTRIPPAKAP